MRAKQKVQLTFPYKMTLFSKPSQRGLIVLGHVFLSMNAFAFLVNSPPLPGIFLALICFSIASLRKDVFSAETITFSFRRLVLALVLVVGLYFISTRIGREINTLWMLLLFTQTPLSINDALHIYRGKMGMTML